MNDGKSAGSPDWIWVEHPFDLDEVYGCFRKTFTLPAKPERARLRITADSRYCLWINGKRVGFGPARCFPEHPVYDSHEVAGFLRRGGNVIAVEVYQPGYSHFSYVHRRAAGLWAELAVGRRKVLRTDDSWKARVDDSYASAVQPISIYGSGQERRDLNRVLPWKKLRFNDGDWAPARVVAGTGMPPWGVPGPSPLPALRETIRTPRKLEVLIGASPEPSKDPGLVVDPHQIVRSIHATAKPRQGTARSVPRGKAMQIVYGLSHSQAGAAEVRITGAKGGERVLLSYFEKGSPGNWVLPDPANYCRVRMTDAFVLAPGTNEFSSFTPRGGRYVMLTVPGPVARTMDIKMKFRSRAYPLDYEPKPDRDATLNRIATMCANTLKACLLDGPVDCAWREQALWSGDGVLTGMLVDALNRDARPLKRVLTLAAQGAYPDGQLPGVAPSEAHAYVVLDYGFSWAEGLAYLARHKREHEFVNGLWPTLTRLLKKYAADRSSDGLLIAQEGRRWFLDWAEGLPRDNPSLFYNLRYLHALQQAAELAGQLGRNEAGRWSRDARRLGRLLKRRFFVDGGWFDEPAGGVLSQHSVAFLVLTGLLRGKEADVYLDRAVERSLDVDESLVLASPYIHFYLFQALDMAGRRDDIEAIVRHRWGAWIARKSPTTWENWWVDFPDGSECHAWSAHPLLFLSP